MSGECWPHELVVGERLEQRERARRAPRRAPRRSLAFGSRGLQEGRIAGAPPASSFQSRPQPRGVASAQRGARSLVACPQSRDRRRSPLPGSTSATACASQGRDLDADSTWDGGARSSTELARVAADAIVATRTARRSLAALARRAARPPRPDPGAVVALPAQADARGRSQRRAVPGGDAALRRRRVRPPVRQAGRRPALAGRVRRRRTSDGLAGAGRAGRLSRRGRGLLSEEKLGGDEVTLEGYVHGGRVTTIGVTDSVMYPGTNSFERFEYPSRASRRAARRARRRGRAPPRRARLRRRVLQRRVLRARLGAGAR